MKTPKEQADEIFFYFDNYPLTSHWKVEMCHNHITAIIEAIDSCMLCKQSVRDYWKEVQALLPKGDNIEIDY